MGTKSICNSHISNYYIFDTSRFLQNCKVRKIYLSVCFKAQYSYTVIEALMAHLDENAKSSPAIRTSIAEVLSKIIAIAAGESVGKIIR